MSGAPVVQRPLELGSGVSVFPARTPTLPPATHTNSYALGEREVVLVEPSTPYDDERRAWLEWVRGLESAGRQPIALFVTHHHADHIGGAAFLARETGLPVWAHAETADRLPGLDVARRLTEGDELVLAGPRVQRWQVLHTPGHAPGHLCLYEPELGDVVVGDMVASVGTILIEPGDGDMRVYLEQLERLGALDAKRALPAHGDAIAHPGELFARYVSHRRMREQKVVSALASFGPPGAKASELVPIAYADTPKNIWNLAELSLIAHLVKLVGEGRVRSDGERYVLS